MSSMTKTFRAAAASRRTLSTVTGRTPASHAPRPGPSRASHASLARFARPPPACLHAVLNNLVQPAAKPAASWRKNSGSVHIISTSSFQTPSPCQELEGPGKKTIVCNKKDIAGPRSDGKPADVALDGPGGACLLRACCLTAAARALCVCVPRRVCM